MEHFAGTMMYTFGPVQYDFAARTHIMGIVNVTPDSFSDGGRWYDPAAAIAHGLQLAADGADILDVGGESTRPGAVPVPADEELRRVVPVIRGLVKQAAIPISIDTTKSAVADAALDAGALIVNDISGLHADPLMAAVTARHHASLILMHMKGTPQSMQTDPVYDDIIGEICRYFGEAIARARAAGVHQLILDPGIGFGKTLPHNLEILRSIGEFRRFGLPVLVGPSRKAFLGAILGAAVSDRMEGTAAAVAAAVLNGAQIVRVHDVREMKRVARVVDAISRPATQTVH
jgi:dihydropteroate synthase